MDVLCIGNANIDIFLQIKSGNTHMHVDEKECELCFPYGQKVLVDGSELVLGGGASNVSVGLSRLGFKTSLVAEVGDDEFAQKIFNTLDNEKVDTSNVIKTPGAASSLSIGINFRGERTLFVKHVQRNHDFSFENIKTQWIYLGGLGKEWKKAYENALGFAKETEVKIVFAPGTTQIEAGYEEIKNVLQVSDILFINKEEAEKITNYKLQTTNEDQNDQIKILLKQLKDLGPKLVVVTDGENGSFCLDQDGKFYFVSGSNVKSVEKTGAGDGYAAGFIAAILSSKDIETAMSWGTKNAGSVIQKVGSQKGLLTKQQLEDNL